MPKKNPCVLDRIVIEGKQVPFNMMLGENDRLPEVKSAYESSKPKPTYNPKRDDEIAYYYSRENASYRGQSRAVVIRDYTNVTDFLASLFVSIHTQQYKVPNWRNMCIGLTSTVPGPNGISLHMPMFDYDGANIKKIIRKDVKGLQEKYGLGDAWVYRTKKGYHVYFFSDVVNFPQYREMLEQTKCCPGFAKTTLANNLAILRVSAKYTAFDITLQYVLPSGVRTGRVPIKKAHLIQQLLGMGQECGTHFASLFPQWARFREDRKEWKLPQRGKIKRIRKVTAHNKEILPGGRFDAPPIPSIPDYKSAYEALENAPKRKTAQLNAKPPNPSDNFYWTTSTAATTSTAGTTTGNFVYIPKNIKISDG